MKTNRRMYASVRHQRGLLEGDAGQGSVEYLMIIALAVCVAVLGAKQFSSSFSQSAGGWWSSITSGVSSLIPF